MKYFFIPGTNPTISLSELLAIFKNGQYSLIYGDIFVLESEVALDPGIIKKLGGTVKFGEIRVEKAAPAALLNKLKSLVEPEKLEEGKFNFGLSYYGKKKLRTMELGMEIKKHLRARGVSCRWVTSKERVLSSVVVEQNKLLPAKGGLELVILEDGDNCSIGITLAVQPFKELSARDYGRPARDDYSGMLPPKLAQIMINLSRRSKGSEAADAVILDPFCGSGTILTEAALMGYERLIGSDISKKAIEDSKKNFDWIKERSRLKTDCRFKNLSATELSRFIKPNSIDAIVTEPYLGPQRGKVEIKKIVRDLDKLYSDSLREFKKVLKATGRIVMIWPVFTNGPQFLNPELHGLKIVRPFPNNFKDKIQLTGRNTMIYGREGQKVWREIVILEK